jgi:hypothetical protein
MVGCDLGDLLALIELVQDRSPAKHPRRLPPSAQHCHNQLPVFPA